MDLSLYIKMMYIYVKIADVIINKDHYNIGNIWAMKKHLNEEVELIQKEVEVISDERDIDSIEELNKIEYDEFVNMDKKQRFEATLKEYDKINELIRAVKQLNRNIGK